MFCLRPAKAMLPSSQGYVSVQSRQSVGIHVTTVCLIPSLDGAAVHGDVGLVQGHAEVILPSGYPFVLRICVTGIDIGVCKVERCAERLPSRMNDCPPVMAVMGNELLNTCGKRMSV